MLRELGGPLAVSFYVKLATDINVSPELTKLTVAANHSSVSPTSCLTVCSHWLQAPPPPPYCPHDQAALRNATRSLLARIPRRAEEFAVGGG